MPAILDRPQPVLPMALGLAQQLEMVPGPRSQRLGRQLTPVLVDHDDGVRALVRLDPEGHHGLRVSFSSRGGTDRSVSVPVGATPRSSQATPAVLYVPGAAKRTTATKALNAVERTPGTAL